MPQALDKTTEDSKVYTPVGEEKKIVDYLKERLPILKETKKKVLGDINFEEIMKDADNEYRPQGLREKKADGSGVMLIQDEIKGIRGSRIVPITGKEGTEWRSDVSEPTLLVKVQTALSILVDQNPEAVFKALIAKYKPTSAVAQAIWKRSWGLAESKEQLKLFIFDLAKYGWAIGRTYPRLVQRDKEILTELDVNDPEKNKYKTIKLTEFNDIYREKLDPYRTWIDDMANLTDPWSQDDWYFEMDFSKDTFDREFSQYSNSSFVKAGQKTVDDENGKVDLNEETKQRADIVTLGFYESKNKDLYAIWEPKGNIVVYSSPLPNDDGLLSCWHAYWNERDPRTPYGIGLYEILKNDKVMYDRLDNMDMDSLVLSIYTMLFYSGSNTQIGDGVNVISPGLMKQKLPGTTIDQVKIDYSGKGAEGADRRRERMDENTGITPTLQGQVEGSTLGEVLHAKDAALKRLNIPLSNIASALQQDAYLTLSWGNQLYSLPEVKEFLSQEDFDEFVKENEIDPQRIVKNESGTITADFPRQMDLSLATDRDGTLIEAPDNRFFTIGKDIHKSALKWKGQITVNAQSIVATSNELERQRKMELFNLVTPIVQAITMAMAQGQMKVAVGMAKPVVQILEIQNEEPEDWLPDDVVKLLNNPELVDQAQAQVAAGAQDQQQSNATDQNNSKPLFIDPSNPPPDASGGAPAPAQGGTAPNIPTAPGAVPTGLPGVVPASQVPNPVKKSMQEVGKVR